MSLEGAGREEEPSSEVIGALYDLTQGLIFRLLSEIIKSCDTHLHNLGLFLVSITRCIQQESIPPTVNKAKTTNFVASEF